ncbi:hypothetical protein FXV83_35850 [Bradyrhizobium hipponense]|uniref:Uncharacterized protein n=1 Tax=Bradyrhizobium hipponense TaxID=2605638 RepID=A0A5S4YCZ4_9BRAD|nr:hypothetical protein [Bradyrhizobium hipponense]TYO61888.1 hypothetical protein FXV83_35850 [Bradyrhizobium hipponense]
MSLVQEQTFAGAIKLDRTGSSTNFDSVIELAARPMLWPERQLFPVEQKALNHVAVSEQGMAK